MPKPNKNLKKSLIQKKVSSSRAFLPHANTSPVVRMEPKYVSIPAAGYAYDTTGSVTLLNGVAEGTDNINRVGRHILTRTIRVRGLIQQNTNSVAAETLCRTLIVYDAQPNGALPSIATILDAANSVANYNVDYFERYKILSDHQIMMGLVITTATQTFAEYPNVTEVDFKVNNTFDTKYIGTSAAIGSVESGAIYLVTIGNNAPGNNYNASFATQLLFTDL